MGDLWWSALRWRVVVGTGDAYVQAPLCSMQDKRFTCHGKINGIQNCRSKSMCKVYTDVPLVFGINSCIFLYTKICIWTSWDQITSSLGHWSLRPTKQKLNFSEEWLHDVRFIVCLTEWCLVFGITTHHSHLCFTNAKVLYWSCSVVSLCQSILY